MGSWSAFSGTLAAPTVPGSLRCRSRARPGSLAKQGFPDTMAARSPSLAPKAGAATPK